jgi:hypothetical protein
MRTIYGLGLVALFAGALACSPRNPNIDGPTCGGIAGISCPGAGACVDDPSDSCNPDAGGADCGGICRCMATGLCVEGQHWDSSPEVCGCVPHSNPCAAVLCPTRTECVVKGGNPVCVPIGGVECGDETCSPGLVCCNASCGICTPPGSSCIQVACD